MPGGRLVVVKVAKPHQDMRFDVPTVGCNTIEALHQARGRVLAVEAGKTILVDAEDAVALANRYGLTIVALGSPSG
jgi:UDP-2,3-diacylglucosamine hydrolase